MNRRSKGVPVLVALLLAACSISPGTTSSTANTDPLTTLPTSTVPVPTLPDGEEVSEEVLEFVAAVDELLIDTAYEDAVTDDPDVFIATGLLFCESLTDGEDPTGLLTSYVETLTGGSVDHADDDTLVLAGSILGATVGYLCPEHTDLIEETFEP